jgi:hypothetical protein
MNFKLLKVLFAALIVLGLQACGDKPAPTPQKTPEQLATEALTGTGTQVWGIAGGGKVTRGGTDVTNLYPNFELILISGSAKTYTSRNSNDLFDLNGNWAFAGTNFDKITMTGTKPASSKEMSFTQSGTNLKLIFSIPVPGARINGTFAIAGDYVFDLIKK